MSSKVISKSEIKESYDNGQVCLAAGRFKDKVSMRLISTKGTTYAILEEAK